jgi:outer membrane protein
LFYRDIFIKRLNFAGLFSKRAANFREPTQKLSDKMKNLIKVFGLMIVLACTASALQAQKFGYVNSSAILAEMPEVKQAETNLEALQKQLQKKLQGQVEQLQQDYLTLQQRIERGELSPKQQEEEGRKLQEREQALGTDQQKMVGEIQSKRDELLKPIYDRVNQAIADVAKENGYTFIFDQQILLYSEDSMDVSAMVKSKL